MKKIVLFIVPVLFVACKKEQATKSVVQDTLGLRTKKSSVTLIIDGKTYVYDHIDWKKSKIKKEEDLRLRILQAHLPRVEFKFPEIQKALSNGEGNFTVPDLDRGLKQLQLKFFDETRVVKNKLNKYIVFRKGEIQAKLSGNNFTMSFTGEGGPMADKTITFPISGTININF